MKLNVENPRDMLVIRMQAWAYMNVLQGDYPDMQKVAESILARFDARMRNNPTEEPGFWASYYFNQFVDAYE